MSCLVLTKEIKELAKKFPNEIEQSVLNLVGLWQEKNDKSIEIVPTESELKKFITDIRTGNRGNALEALKQIGITLNDSLIDNYLSNIRETNPYHQVFKQMVGILKTNNIPISIAADTDLSSIASIAQDGFKTATIRFNPERLLRYLTKVDINKAKSTVFRILTHELVHAVTADVLESHPSWSNIRGFDKAQKEFNKDIWDLFEYCKEYLKDTEWYGLKNEKEFVAEAFTNRDFQIALSEIKTKEDNAFKRFINYITNLFNKIFEAQGINISSSALEDVISISEKYFEYATKELNKNIDDFFSEGLNNYEDNISQEVNKDPYYIKGITTIEEQQKVDTIFDPAVRRDRVSLIARFFSNIIDQELAKSTEGTERFDIIKSLTPRDIFNKVAGIFKEYINYTDEQRVEYELSIINKQKGAEKYSDEQKRTAAKKKADYKLNEYRKVVDDPAVFKALAEEASTILIFTEGIRVDPNYTSPDKANFSEDDPEGNSKTDNAADEWSQEEAYKDGWMTNVRQISSHESLSQAVRAVIRKIPRLDYKGKYDKDDLGFPRYLEADYVHATLIDKLKDMVNSEDMIPLLEEMSTIRPWVKQIVKLLKADNNSILYSQFYQDFRKDFMPYWIQKRKLMPDGTYKTETISINKPEGIYYLLEAWRDNYENGIILTEDSIYGKNGRINIGNASKNLELIKDLNNRFSGLSKEDRFKLLDNGEVWYTILKLLKAVGINTNPDTLKTALVTDRSTEAVTYTDPIMLLLPQLNIIFKGVKDGEVQDEVDKNGIVKRGDLINTFGNAYRQIANMLADVTDDAIESSVRENDKSYYSHVTPNYLGKLIKNLKNVMKDKKRFDEFIQTEFKDYEWFFKNGEWRNDWLKQLVESKDMRDGFSHKVVLNADKVEYSDWDSLDYILVMLNEYWGEPDSSNTNKHFAWYHVPILSDSPSAEFIRFRKYKTGDVLTEEGRKRTYDDVILDKLMDIVNQEYDRIMLVNERFDRWQKGDKAIVPIANFDSTVTIDEKGKTKINKNGAEFKFFPYLNDLKYEDGKYFIDKLGELKERVTGAELKSFIRETLTQMMEEQFEETFSKWENVGLLDTTDNGKYKYLPFSSSSRDKVKEALREYYWNSKLATSQIIQLTTTDLAFYKNIEDFQKRYKEIHAPSLRLNTKATYKGKRVGKDFERALYLTDNIIVSSAIKDIEKVFNMAVENNEITREEADTIIKKYKEVNVADAQAYRSLDSYRAILCMQGKWTDEMEDTYNRITEGNFDIKDINTIWQTIKPFVYTQINNDSGVQGEDGKNIRLKTPVQHKNSELVLLAMYSVTNQIFNNGKLAAINRFMKDYNIDVVMFESAVKAGNQGTIDLNVIADNKVYEELVDKTGVSENDKKGNPNVIHTISYEDYGIQTATPEHAIDAVQLVGTQIRKLITSDISNDPDIRFTINGKQYTKKELIDLYNKINTENIIEKFSEVDKIFSSAKEIEKVLLEEIRGSQRYGVEMARACTLDENGNFNIPLFDPVQSLRVQTLLNSVIKSRITKQKIKGGALIQASPFGVAKSNDLHIVFNEDGSIKYFECYIPIYDRKLYDLCIDKDGKLNVDKLPDKLRKFIGYRVPTEAQYSMAPLYIKGFTPIQNGSVIMLPSEITTIAGSDYDVDKLYVMFPELEIINKYNMKGAWDDFYLNNPDIVDEIDRNIGLAFEDWQSKHPDETDIDLDDYIEALRENKVKKYLFSKDAQERFKEWFKENKQNYLVSKKAKKIEYNTDKSVKDNGVKARNNMLIDMMWGILTNKDTASKILNPGSFDYQKKAARIVSILNNSTRASFSEALKVEGITLKSVDDLFRLSLKKLNKLASKTKYKMDPLSPFTQIMLHQQNMTGAKLISIYANHNANHALMQLTELELNDKYGSFQLNGKTLTSLHSIMNGNKEFISKNNAGYLAASVDNVKDPVLAALNQNTFTADATMLLSRLGYNPIEVGLLMTQPIVLEITNDYFRNNKLSKSKNDSIDDIIKKYEKLVGLQGERSYDDYKNNLFLLKDLISNILDHNELNNLSDEKKVKYYMEQVKVGYLFSRIMESADALGKLVQATRADTQNGAAGPTIADTELKIQKVEDFIEKVVKSKKSPLINANIIEYELLEDINNEEEIRRKLIDSKLPFLQAFYSLGIERTERLLSSQFPQSTESFKEVVSKLKSITRTGRLDVKTLNNIYNDLLAYIMTKNDFFGNEAILDPSAEGGQVHVSSSQRRNDFINGFPAQFKKIVSENPDIASLEFIKRLKVIRVSETNPVATLVFKNVGQLSSTLRERYMRDWASLLYMENPVAQTLALNLFRYSFYRNGFAFGPNTFIHLAPTVIRKIIPNYISTLRELTRREDNYEQFVNQYIYNHLDNRRFVPEIQEGSTVNFIDNDGNIKDTVAFEINNNTMAADKKVIHHTTVVDGIKIYGFMNFIARREKGKWIYYKLDNSLTINDGETATAVYNRIQPLGFRNSFIEYEYGVNAEDMQSVINKNNINYDPYSDTVASYSFVEGSEDYDKIPENTDNISPNIYASYEVYGTNLDIASGAEENDILSLLPNPIEDAEGKIACGVPIIATL